MPSEIQLLANRANAQLSTGPVTADGKQRSSRNATALGLFSASAFIRPDEHHAYRKFRTAWNAHLAPDGPVEEALVAELVQAAWRLRRCTALETATPYAPTQDAPRQEDIDRMQASIDRARTTSQRALQRNLTELRRIQTERQMRNAMPVGYQAHAKLGAASIGDIENFINRIAHRHPADVLSMVPVTQHREITKRSQSDPAPRANSTERSQSDPPPTPRSAPCPCGSGEKYKRCCGKNAPPVLCHAA
jgi:SEC-C motif